jgi:hypothetical protein
MIGKMRGSFMGRVAGAVDLKAEGVSDDRGILVNIRTQTQSPQP